MLFGFLICNILITSSVASRQIKDEYNEDVVLSTYGKELKIKCEAEVSLSYCWIKHPNGTEFTPIASDSSKRIDLQYTYDDSKLSIGKCTVIFKKSTFEDAGIWTCHMGQLNPVGIELSHYIKVRVGSAIAAVDPIIPAKLGESTTLKCVTAAGNLPLKYCRFSGPDGTRLNIDNSIMFHNAINQQFYFDEDSHLNSGDCTMTIKNVTEEYYGTWMCSAMIEEEMNEYSDFILLEWPDKKNLSTASVVGLSIGVIMVIGLTGIIGFIFWRRRKYNEMVGSVVTAPAHATGRPTIEEPIAYFRPSGDSDSSDVQVGFGGEIQRQNTYGITGRG